MFAASAGHTIASEELIMEYTDFCLQQNSNFIMKTEILSQESLA